MNYRGWALAGAVTLASALAGCDNGADLWRPVTIDGAVTTPRSATKDTFAPTPITAQSVTFSAAGVQESHTYYGASLWGLLQQAGVQVDPAVKNDILGKYVLATGSDGYRAVFSMGELSPDFGNRSGLVTYEEAVAGGTQVVDPVGFSARVTAPGDIKGGRYVSLLTDVQARDSGSATTTMGGGAVGSFTITGDVLHPGTFDAAALQALPPVSLTVGGDTWTGVSLWSLLSTTAGLSLPAGAKNAQLAMYVVATGSDGYKALVALGELDTGFGNQPDLVATAVNGVPLDDDGFARIVVPNDVKHGRWVSNLVNLEVFTAAP